MVVVVYTATGDRAEVCGPCSSREAMWMSMLQTVLRNHVEVCDLCSR